jgi:hypothetical protein
MMRMAPGPGPAFGESKKRKESMTRIKACQSSAASTLIAVKLPLKVAA